MAIRTKTQIITDAITFIAQAIPNIATFVGSVVRDLVIESPAEEFENVYEELSRTQKLQSLVYAEDQTTDELDAFALNFGLTRLEGSAASGSITFQIHNFSTSSSDISIPIGTVVGTTGTDDVQQATFLTTQALLFQAAFASSYFNPTSGLYELTASIKAETVGESTNVAAGTIRALISSIPGITSVINTVATTGGEDVESNEDFATRIQVKLSGNNVGTVNGIRSLVTENVNVIDVEIVTPNDVEMIRDEFGGEVDVYVIGEVLSNTQDIIFYTAAGTQEFVLQRQPASSIISVTGLAGATPFTFTEGLDFNFVLDTTILFNGSSRLENKIVFNIGGTNPDDGTNVTVAYVYNSLIETLQTQLDADDGHIVTADVLVKEAIEAVIDIELDVKLFPGNSTAQAISDIQTALSNEINNLGIGDSIDRSDVIGTVEGVASVDQINVNTLILEKNGNPLPPTEQRLQIFKTEYPRVSTITVNIV